MKKKTTLGIVSLLGIASTSLLGFTTLTSCTKQTDPTPPGPEPEPEEDTIFNIAFPGTNGGMEFAQQFQEYMSDEKSLDEQEYHFNEIPVKFTMIGQPEDQDYSQYVAWLDEKLPKNESLPEEEKIDLFVAEPEYIYKYVNSELTNDLGFSADDFSQSYAYPLGVCTDAQQKIKGACLNFCPSVLFYDRQTAYRVLGYNDPVQINKETQTWDGFANAGEKIVSQGFYVTASYKSTFRAYCNNMEIPWVNERNELQVNSEVLDDWIDMAFEQYRENWFNDVDQFTDEWGQEFTDGSKLFCEFGPRWFYNDRALPASVTNWGVCVGPQPFDWGGTYVLAATDGSNDDEVKSIIQMLNNDGDMLSKICNEKHTFVNNMSVNQKKAQDPDYGNEKLGGQNEWGMLEESAQKLVYKNATKYDNALNDLFFKTIFDNYFQGATDKQGAIDEFKKAVKADPQFDDIIV